MLVPNNERKPVMEKSDQHLSNQSPGSCSRLERKAAAAGDSNLGLAYRTVMNSEPHKRIDDLAVYYIMIPPDGWVSERTAAALAVDDPSGEVCFPFSLQNRECTSQPPIPSNCILLPP